MGKKSSQDLTPDCNRSLYPEAMYTETCHPFNPSFHWDVNQEVYGGGTKKKGSNGE